MTRIKPVSDARGGSGGDDRDMSVAAVPIYVTTIRALGW
jgi:hypothetical protein